MRIFNSVVFVAAVASAGSGHAQNLLVNGSFENTNGTFVDNSSHIVSAISNNASSTLIPGWTVTTHLASWIRNDNAYGLLASNGSFQLDLTGPSDNGYAGVRQTFATQAGAIYRLTFDMGGNGSCPGFDCTGPMTIRADVAALSQNFVGLPDPMTAGQHWQSFSVNFTALAATTTLTLTALQTANGSVQYRGLDNVSVELVTPVPEPESFAMMLAGIGLLGWRLRRNTGHV